MRLLVRLFVGISVATLLVVGGFAYHEVRSRFGLSSQMAQLAIKSVCDVYRRLAESPHPSGVG